MKKHLLTAIAVGLGLLSSSTVISAADYDSYESVYFYSATRQDNNRTYVNINDNNQMEIQAELGQYSEFKLIPTENAGNYYVYNVGKGLFVGGDVAQSSGNPRYTLTDEADAHIFSITTDDAKRSYIKDIARTDSKHWHAANSGNGWTVIPYGQDYWLIGHYAHNSAEQLAQARDNFNNHAETLLAAANALRMKAERHNNAAFLKNASQISVNSRENQAGEGIISSMFDDNENTYFHSGWSAGNTVATTENHWFAITFDNPSNCKDYNFTYIARKDNSVSIPTAISVYGSTDGGTTWSESPVAELSDGLNQARGTVAFSTAEVYNALKFVITAANNTGFGSVEVPYYCFAEIGLEPQNGTPSQSDIQYYNDAMTLINSIDICNDDYTFLAQKMNGFDSFGLNTVPFLPKSDCIYRIKLKGHDLYIQMQTPVAGDANNSTVQMATVSASIISHMAFEKHESENKWAIRCVETNKYFASVGNWHTSILSETPYYWSIEQSGYENDTPSYLIRGPRDSGNDRIGPNNSDATDGAKIWSNHDASKQNIHWEFIETPIEASTFTLNVYDNTVNKLYKTITADMIDGQAYDIAIPFIKERATGVFSSEEPTVTLYGTPDLPFAYSLTAEGELPWQAAHQNRGGDSKWWKYTADNDANLLESNNAEYDNKATVLDDSRLWTFVGNLADGFKIYNKAAGLNKPLHKNGNAVVVGESSENDTWFVFLNKNNAENACCFKGENTNYFNAQGNSIKFWHDADNGSTSWFQAVATPLLGYSEGLFSIPVGVVGRPLTDCGVNAAREAANANKYDYAAATALSEAIAAYGDEEVVTFDSAVYYRLLNKQSRNYLVSGKDDNMNVFGGESAPLTNHNSIVKFEPTGAENTYNIISQDYYFGKLGALEAQLQQSASAEGAGNYQIVAHTSDEGAHFIKDIDQDLMHVDAAYGLMNCLHYWADGGNSIIPQVDAWELSKWYLEPATEIEVALTFTDGSYNVALAYFPFPVVCTDGSTLCTVFEGTHNTTGENAVSYTEVQSVPANTAFLIRNNEVNTARLSIDYQGISTAAANDGNLLAGSNRAISAKPGDYVLADSEKGLAFVKQAEAATVAGNYAYMPAANVSDPKTEIYPFASPDMVTSIVDINADNTAEKVIYDLQGRRISKAVKGVYIINGNKVYVK